MSNSSCNPSRNKNARAVTCIVTILFLFLHTFAIQIHAIDFKVTSHPLHDKDLDYCFAALRPYVVIAAQGIVFGLNIFYLISVLKNYVKPRWYLPILSIIVLYPIWHYIQVFFIKRTHVSVRPHSEYIELIVSWTFRMFIIGFFGIRLNYKLY